MSQLKVSAKRHLAKTISYRLISTLIGFVIMWTISGSIKIGASFGIVELIYKPLQYYIHERVWYKWIKFGLITNIQTKKPKKIKSDSQVEVSKTEEPIVKRLTYSKKTN